MTGRTALSVAATVCLISAPLSGCSTSALGHSDPGLGPAGKPIVIAAVKGLTGSLSSFDGPPVITAQMAVDDINSRGGVDGHPLQLIKVDTQSDVSHDQQATLHAIKKGASFIIAPCDFDTGAPVAIVAQAAQLVAMSDCAGAPEFGKQGIGPYAFTMGLVAQSEGAALAQFAAGRNWHRAFILRDTTLEYHRQVTDGFIDRFAGDGNQIVSQATFEGQDNSISTQIGRIRDSGPIDFILLMSFPPGGASALRQLRAAGINVPVLASNSFDGDYWKSAVANVSDVYYTNYSSLSGDDPDSARTAVIERFKQITGGYPSNTNVVTGYSVIQAFKIAAERCTCRSGPGLVTAFESFKNEPLLVGPTTFTDTLHVDPVRPLLVMQIDGGRSRFVTEIAFSSPPHLPL
ncbi:ABC transporter substrate-binding protein [Mycobacterium aquaticum]|uniref:Leucine-binding protein domain-containing protein n=1 Tax=Mycobacterium aquaticum TaxID=1927124 RepID=A0A1X0BA70_9MYCO|nr:ABC transporter substrate-binding protein [Mycobacterium aquaticum]ORA39241.1 hypothetical protein BST13_02970 [Mycobacterium aquaticum]